MISNCGVDHNQMYWTMVAIFNPLSGSSLDQVFCPVCNVNLHDAINQSPYPNQRY